MVETTSRIASSSSTTNIFSVSTVARLPVVIIREVTPLLGRSCPFRKQHVSVRINGFLSRQAAVAPNPHRRTGVIAGREANREDGVSFRKIRVYLPSRFLKRPPASFSLCYLHCSTETIVRLTFVFGFVAGSR